MVDGYETNENVMMHIKRLLNIEKFMTAQQQPLKRICKYVNTFSYAEIKHLMNDIKPINPIDKADRGISI